MTYRSGRHFLQLPGPTNIPDRVLRAMDGPTIDHRGPEFAVMTRAILEELSTIFGCSGPVFVFPSSASGCWEAALVNTFSPGDRLLAFDHGFFAAGWQKVAARMGLAVDVLPGDWRCGVGPETVEAKLAEDPQRAYRGVLVVHNETSTGVTSGVAAIRAVLDRLDHPALLLVDAVSSLGSIEYLHDAWRVDVTVAGSQKGLMLPPGLGFTAVSERALAASRTARLPRSYWDWEDMRLFNEKGFFPYTPATNLLYGLREALTMFREEGMPTVFARHQRLAEATRRAVTAWGLEIFATQPDERSNTVTTVAVPNGCNADDLRRVILERYNMSLGGGLGKLQGRVFRIGHVGDLNELMLAGTLCGVEMGLRAACIPHQSGGVNTALEYLSAPTG